MVPDFHNTHKKKEAFSISFIFEQKIDMAYFEQIYVIKSGTRFKAVHNKKYSGILKFQKHNGIFSSLVFFFFTLKINLCGRSSK